MADAAYQTISNVLRIQSRYVRSVDIERDSSDEHALEGYAITSAAREALARIAAGLRAGSTHRAWRITGAYGSGKSAFGLALVSSVRGHFSRRGTKGQLAKAALDGSGIRPRDILGYEPVVLSGKGGDLATDLASALRWHLPQRSRNRRVSGLAARLESFVENRSVEQSSPLDFFPLLREFLELSGLIRPQRRGTLLVIDELGRYVEHATSRKSPDGPGFVQSLAEHAAGAGDHPLAIVALLHQRFEDYRHDDKLGEEQAQEWRRVAERFEDIPFDLSFDDQSHRLALALNVDTHALEKLDLRSRAETLYREAIKLRVLPKNHRGSDIDSLAAAQYPMHPASLVALDVFTRRFGQHQRSWTAFLLSSEVAALRDFTVRHAPEKSTWYRLSDLANYVLEQGPLRSLDPERIRRWEMLNDRVRDAATYSELEQKIVKSVGLLNTLEPVPGLPVTEPTLAFALGDSPKSKSVRTAIDALLKRQVLYRRPSSSELCLWPQTSINLRDEFQKALGGVSRRPNMGEVLELLSVPRPTVAHRHYIVTGTQRLVRIAFKGDWKSLQKPTDDATGSSDAVLYVVPVEEHIIDAQLSKLTRNLGKGTLVCLREVDDSDTRVFRDLLAWRRVKAECVELAVDTFARNEVLGQLEHLGDEANRRLADISAPELSQRRMRIAHDGQVHNFESGRDLNSWLSDVMDDLYPNAPFVHNELLNRRQLSSAAAAARNRLIAAMVQREEIEALGIDKTPPEMSMYLSVLAKGGWHRRGKDGRWRLLRPRKSDPANWAPAWNAVHHSLHADEPVLIAQVLEQLSLPPFGMRPAVAELVLVAVMLRHRTNLVLMEKESYVPDLTASHLERLCKSPESFRATILSGNKQQFEVLLAYVKAMSVHTDADGREITIASVLRQIYQWFLQLPEYAHHTNAVGAPTHEVRNALRRSTDPQQLLFSEIPSSLGVRETAGTQIDPKRLEIAFGAVTNELTQCVEALSRRLSAVLGDALNVEHDLELIRSEILRLWHAADPKSISEYRLRSIGERAADADRTDEAWLLSAANVISGRAVESWTDETEAEFRPRAIALCATLQRLAALSATAEAPGPTPFIGVHVVRRDGHEDRFLVSPTAGQEERMLVKGRIREALQGVPNPRELLAELIAEDTGLELQVQAQEDSR